jgi:aminoglycoside phosphotransferase (APT) family kinase protein
MTSGHDAARPVRDEDAFDVGAVHGWLSPRVEGLGDDPPEVRQFSGGASNLTYLLSYPARDLVLRRPPHGTKAASAHDMAREHRVQARLAPVFPYVPAMVAYCDDTSVVGSEFYVMERLEGVILRANPPASLGLTEDRTRALCTTVIDRLADLHAVDVAAAGLSDLGRGSGYVERQVAGWSERYRAARTWNVPRFERVMAWLEAERPDDVGTCLIHNDYRFDNVVIDHDDPTRVVGVLDWEMATLGDPLMDLGAALAYWVQADDDRLFRAFRRQPTHLPGMLTRAEVVRRYADRSGLDVADWRFYEVYGLFRLAVIVQQIYARYAAKQTRNPAFRHFWLAVHLLERRCRRVIDHEGT